MRKQSVKLREKKLKGDRKSLYLDIWSNGKRRYEFLKLYLEKPANTLLRNENRRTRQLGESIRAKRQLELQNEAYGITSDLLNADLIEYFESVINKKESKGTKQGYSATLKHLRKYCPGPVLFKDVNVHFLEEFKEYLMHEARTKNNQPLSKNSQHEYWAKLKAVLNQAILKGIIVANPAKRVKGIKGEPTAREFLTLDELRKLTRTDCKHGTLKRAFLFSCLTGIRWSDVSKLIWSEVQENTDNWRIVFRQKKTQRLEYLDIGEQARKYLGKRGEPETKVFSDLMYNNNALQKWCTAAGVDKKITFHVSRHTFSLLQLQAGTDLFVLSKLLGHVRIKTTEIYAQILDQKKQEAMNRIPDIE
jgi:integrase